MSSNIPYPSPTALGSWKSLIAVSMDSTFGQQSQIDVNKLSDGDKRDLQQTLGQEMQKAKLQESVHNLTEICWTKCITGSIKSGQLEKNEATCAQNCVERFLDANESVLNHLQKLQGRM